MNTKMNLQLLATSLITILFLGIGGIAVKAETSSDQKADSHGAHHPESQGTQNEGNQSDMMGKGGMMDKMDMNQMKGMMHDCMEMHKDGKMCDHQMMEKCQKNMSKQECMKMMGQSKKDETKKTK